KRLIFRKKHRVEPDSCLSRVDGGERDSQGLRSLACVGNRADKIDVLACDRVDVPPPGREIVTPGVERLTANDNWVKSSFTQSPQVSVDPLPLKLAHHHSLVEAA